MVFLLYVTAGVFSAGHFERTILSSSDNHTYNTIQWLGTWHFSGDGNY